MSEEIRVVIISYEQIYSLLEPGRNGERSQVIIFLTTWSDLSELSFPRSSVLETVEK